MAEDQEPKELIQRAPQPSFLSDTRFEDFILPAEILAGLKDAGFTYCTPIQAQVLPLALAGRDVAGQAQTGTGKTAAFLVAIFARLLASEKQTGVPSALIVAPTRELAAQIYEDAKIIGGHTGLKLVQVVGGVDYQKQAETLSEGVDVVIGTPGRLIDYLKQGIFKTSGIQALVIDEADRLFDLGFTRDMRYILRKLPPFGKRLSMLFSATLSYRILALTYEYMNVPEFISVAPQEVAADGIEQSLFHVASDEKLRLLLELLKREKWSRILIFLNTKAGVEWLAHQLKGNRFPCEGITGDLPQKTRFSLMARFKGGSVKILVATDVASRGIHVEDISHVINYELPENPESYIHRIGRTARAGKTGKAISFACEDCVFYLEPLENRLGYKLPVVWPQDDWFVEDKSPDARRESEARPEKPERSERPERPERPEPERVRTTEKRIRVIQRAGKKIIFSSEPGGIFGLAPLQKQHQKTDQAEGKREKPGRRRRKHYRPKVVSPSSAAPGDT